MRFRRPIALALLALPPLACSLVVETEGLSGDGAAAQGDGGPAPDSPRAPDADPADAADDRQTETGPGPCVALVQNKEAFTSTFGAWTPKRSSPQVSFTYPFIEPFDGKPAAVLFPIVTSEFYSTQSSLWLTSPVPLVALDVEADVDVRCSGPGSCGDGFAAAWLDTTDASQLDGIRSSAVPLPDGVKGVAVVLDDYQNDVLHDPPAPSLQIVRAGSIVAGDAGAWQVASVGAAFLGGPHHLGIQLRGENVRVSLDGVVRVAGKVPTFTKGLFGFTAGTGGQTDAVAIRNVDASFYDCTPVP